VPGADGSGLAAALEAFGRTIAGSGDAPGRTATGPGGTRAAGETGVAAMLARASGQAAARESAPAAAQTFGRTAARSGGAPTPSGAAPRLDPSELAALVNEALVEQARLHGVDIA
jgi:hypothetical protein